jgi:hypothetical protein
VCLEASTKSHVKILIHEFLINMAFIMACPNFKKGLKMVSGPLGVKAQHAVRLNLIHVYQRTMPYPSKVEVYMCHRGRKFWGKAFNIDDTNDQIRQRSSKKFVGYSSL